MAKTINFKEVEVGDDLPTLVKRPTTKQLVMFAAASDDYNPIHYDKDFALKSGLPGVIVHGPLTAAFLAQLLTDWIGEKGKIKKLGTNNRKIILPNEDLLCKGKAVKKYSQNDGNYIECEIWAENSRGEKCVTGSAVVMLPHE